jgi:hypothetical protein
MAGEFLDQIQVLKVWHLSFIVSSNIQATWFSESDCVMPECATMLETWEKQ